MQNKGIIKQKRLFMSWRRNKLIKIKFFLIFLVFLGCRSSYAELNLKNYKNCTGIPIEKNFKFNSNFTVFDSYKRNEYDYSIIIDKTNKKSTECLVINNNRKVIVDIIPSLVSRHCGGQWIQNKNIPVWASDIGGGKDGVEYISYSTDENLKRLNNEDYEEIQQIIDSINCQINLYTKKDIRELNDTAFFLYKMGRLNESLSILNKVIDLDPKRTVAYLNLGDVYMSLKKEELARKNYLIYSELMKKNGLENKIPVRIRKYL